MPILEKQPQLFMQLHRYLSQTPQDEQSSAAIAFLASLDHIAKQSPKIAEAIASELTAQRSQLKLISSENYCSLAVQLAMGNLLTDKYAEGFVKHRFYAGCENVDVCEQEAVNQLKEIYGCDHAYVQPHSGADANIIAFWSLITHKLQDPELEKMGKSLLELTDEEHEKLRQKLVNCKVLGMSLDAGGHLTHGFRQNISAKMMHAKTYSIDPQTERLDYANIQKQAQDFRPDILIAGYSAYSRRINFAKMREIADSVGAKLMVDMAHFSGLVAGKVFQGEENPVPYAHIVTSTTHKTLRGPRGGLILCQKELAETVNRGCPLAIGGPLPHVMAAKAVAFQEANSINFQTYAHQVVENSRALAEVFLKEGIRVISGGTDNHMFVLDVSSFKITGRQAESALLDCGICLNRNAILNDPNGAWYTSGVRVGTPALTTLGMKQAQMQRLGKIMIQILKETKAGTNPKTNKASKAKYILDESTRKKCSDQVVDLLKDFPLYPEITLQ